MNPWGKVPAGFVKERVSQKYTFNTTLTVWKKGIILIVKDKNTPPQDKWSESIFPVTMSSPVQRLVATQSGRLHRGLPCCAFTSN